MGPCPKRYAQLYRGLQHGEGHPTTPSVGLPITSCLRRDLVSVALPNSGNLPNSPYRQCQPPSRITCTEGFHSWGRGLPCHKHT